MNISKPKKPRLERPSKKYAQVQSKVKQYRMEIKKQDAHNKNKSRKHLENIESTEHKTEKCAENSETLEDLQQKIREQKNTITFLELQNRELLEQVADLQVRLDHFRIELSSKITSPRSVPVSKQLYRRTLMNTLQSPFKMLGDAMKASGKTNDDSILSEADQLECSVNSFYESNKSNINDSSDLKVSSNKIKPNNSFASKILHNWDKVATLLKIKSKTQSDTTSSTTGIGYSNLSNNICDSKTSSLEIAKEDDFRIKSRKNA